MDRSGAGWDFASECHPPMSDMSPVAKSHMKANPRMNTGMTYKKFTGTSQNGAACRALEFTLFPEKNCNHLSYCSVFYRRVCYLLTNSIRHTAFQNNEELS